MPAQELAQLQAPLGLAVLERLLELGMLAPEALQGVDRAAQGRGELVLVGIENPQRVHLPHQPLVGLEQRARFIAYRWLAHRPSCRAYGRHPQARAG